MPTLEEDRQRLIAAMAQEPLEKLEKEAATQRVTLGTHLDQHKDCSDKCPTRVVLRSQIETTVAAIRVRRTQ